MFNQLLTTIMKKNLWILAAALCMTACSQNEDIVIEQPVTDSDFESPDGRLIIQLGGIESRHRSQRRRNTRPLDKLYDDTDGATTQLGIFALATNDATNNTAITDANRTAAWGDTDNYGILLNNVQAAVTAWPQQGGTVKSRTAWKTTRRRRLHYIKIMPQTVSTTIRCRRNTTILSTATPPIKPTKPSAPQNRK